VALIKVDEKYRLTEDWGQGPGYLLAGTEVTVDGIHEPGTPGLGLTEHDTVTATYVMPDGAVRTIALPEPEFSTRFKKVA